MAILSVRQSREASVGPGLDDLRSALWNYLDRHTTKKYAGRVRVSGSQFLCGFRGVGPGQTRITIDFDYYEPEHHQIEIEHPYEPKIEELKNEITSIYREHGFL